MCEMAVMRQIALAVTLAVVATALLTGCPESPESAVVDTAVPPVNGNAAAGPGPGGEATTITAKGSDTLLQVAQALAEAYMKQHPDLDITVTGGGTGTGFTALVQGTADIADASRKIKDEEAKACKDKGVEPMENLVGYDGIAVIVNKASPVTKLTMDQLSDLYTGQIRDWKALGGKGEVVLLSRDSTSGTYEYFKEHVVQKGDKKSKRDFAPSASRLPSTSQIVERVAKTEGAIGYVGLGYLDDSVKTVPIVDKSGKPITPSIGTVKSGAYPISRPLFMYTKQDAGDAIKGYMDWIVSPAGQDVIKQEGFVPLK
jgi:phosphate transport system substrate-binding protein